MTQHELVKEYIKENGSRYIYKGIMMGSEISKRCRELRKQGILRSERDGKFERFYLNKPVELPVAKIVDNSFDEIQLRIL